jgi:hypothetical protein
MFRHKRLLLGSAVCLAFLASASSAFAAGNTINVARFSKTVSGNTGTAYAGVVTVNLLRNTFDVKGVATRNPVDTCTATASGATGAWMCSFATHAFAGSEDLVEVNYAAGSGAPTKLTVLIGDGRRTAQTPPTPENVTFGNGGLDGTFGIAAGGATLSDFGGCSCGSYTATVDGIAAPVPVAGVVTFTTPVTDANNVQITGKYTGGSGTTVNLMDGAPLLAVAPAGYAGMAPYNTSRSEPTCTFYLATSEYVCNNLTPGTFTVKQLRGAATVSTQTFSVPAQTGDSVPSEGGVKLMSVAPGDQLELLVGSHLYANVTVAGLVTHWASPITDIENGHQNTLSGTCVNGNFFSGQELLCSGAAIPGAQAGEGPGVSQLDDTGGTTTVDYPDIPVSVPRYGELVHTPATALVILRYEDQIANALSDDSAPSLGQSMVAPTIPSAIPVTFSYAPLGTSAFTTAVGNANGGLGAAIPSLGQGAYDGRWTYIDARGDTYSSDSPFVSQGGGPTVHCTAAKGSGGVKAHVNVARKGSSSSSGGLKVTCSPSVAGARVALWLISGGHTVVASGSSIASGTSATVTLTGTFKKGTYSLVETASLNGQSTESTQVLTITSGPKAHKKHKKHKKH